MTLSDLDHFGYLNPSISIALKNTAHVRQNKFTDKF